MIQRKEYLDKLLGWKDEKVIKVITGIRRCGKSTLLEQFRDLLLKDGIQPEQIQFMNFEDMELEPLLAPSVLHKHILERLISGKMNYIFLDEIQKVSEYQKVVDSLYIRDNVDIYITGSNAYLLSGELATLLSGRYVEINMLPLSFAEYCEARGDGNKDTLFAEYMRRGGFPYASLIKDDDRLDMYFEGVYNTIILKDIEERQKRREADPNKRKITDIVLLKNISRFLAGSIGSPIAIKNIAAYITSGGRKVSENTVSDYTEALAEPYIFYPVERFDVVGKQLLKTMPKYYIVDLGIRRHLLPRKNYDLGFSLENIIYFELLRRGYKVSIGKVGNTEVDFVAEKNERYYYFQVTASMTDENTFEREIRPLRSITDNYRKTILTLDRFTVGDYEGIEVINAVDWLLNRE